MRNFINKLILILILLLIWISLNEDMSLESVIFGGIFSIISVFLPYYIFGDNDNITTYYMPVWFFFLYFFMMVFYISKDGVCLIINLLKGRKNPRVVKIKSKLKNPWYVSIVANSITLTPGTVTLDKTGNTMEVLYYLGGSDDAFSNYQDIAWKFEKLFLLIDGKR